jgi:hypothetical protein
LFFNSTVHGQIERGFKGIQPIISTCLDVERVLNIKACSQHEEIKYQSDSGEVQFFILNHPCQAIFRKQWNFPAGTVIGIYIDFKKNPISLDSLKVNLTEFKKSYSDIETFYRSEKEGVEFSIIGNVPESTNYQVRQIGYFPRRKETKLCTSNR